MHFFGGRARFGVRMDVDPIVRPDVIGDAWLPPFAERSFDHVVLDPPYLSFSREVLFTLLRAAAYVCRSRVIWLGHIWCPSGVGLVLERAWLVRCGDSQIVRALQVFRRNEKHIYPTDQFVRGPAMRYNRWLAQPQGFAFPPHQEAANEIPTSK